MKTKILIAGGLGSIGSILSNHLFNKYRVAILSRKKKGSSLYPIFQWDAKRGFIDERSFLKTEHIINLCGTNILKRRWTVKQKEEILHSRTRPIAFLREYINKNSIPIQSFISASAIGIYPNSSEIQTEQSPVGNDFLAKVCSASEKEVEKMNDKNVRTVIIRIGFVLSAHRGSVFHMINKSINYMLGCGVGNGKQILSWIHIKDLCRLFEYVIENKIHGVVNAVTPYPVSMDELMKQTAKEAKKKIWLPNIPEVFIKTALGERGGLLLDSKSISPRKILDEGFEFEFPKIQDAVQDLVNNKEEAYF